MKVTIGLGGSAFNPKEIRTDVIEEFVEAAGRLKEKGHEILVVTGGGDTSRKYIDAARELEATHKDLDQIGIDITRINAKLFISAMDELAAPEPTTNFEKAVRITFKNKIPVMGGTQPGHTTDAVAAKLADSSKSDLLIFITDVDGIYTSDPKKDRKAKKIVKLTSNKLAKLMSKMDFKPGMTAIIDPLASEIIRNKKIKTLVLGKDEIIRLPKIVEGADHSGTTVLIPK